LKKATAILFLLVFAVQSLSFKTHVCYHNDGTRYHGDCTQEMSKTEHSGHSKSSFHEQKYECFDVKLDKQYQQHYSFKNFNDQYIVLVSVPELPLITFIQKRQTIPIFSCRGGPPILTQSLRGPPLV